jgi:hypothetical protein
MSVDAALYTRLVNFSGLTNLVGTRISPAPLVLGQDLPAVTYQLVSRVAEITHDDAGGLWRSRFQVDAFGLTALESINVFAQVTAAINGYRGTLAGVRLTILHYEERSLVDATPERFRRTGDFIIWSDI